MKQITQKEIKHFSDYVYKISGIHLDETKGYLLESRLNPLLLSYHLDTYDQLLEKARQDRSGDLRDRIIDAVSTNETFFFRDNTPFNILQYKLIPELIDRRQKLYKSKQIPLRILSAACSSGQEVYSIGITLLEEIPNINDFDITILGVDIADEVIAKASYGKYGKFEVERGLSPAMLNKYFKKHDDGWRIKDKVRVMANFKKVNLLETFSNIGYFDIIFCRNVAIYFKYNDKVKLFKKLARILEPDGALIVGGSESLTGVAPDFKVNHYLKGIYYTLKDDSKEKSKEVKKFEVHTFSQKKNKAKPKKVKRIKRTIRYVNKGNQQQKSTQSALDRLKEKRKIMAQKSEEFQSSREQNTEIKQEAATAEVAEKVEAHGNPPTKQKKKNNRSLHAVINSQRSSNQRSLLGSISQKYTNSSTLNIKSKRDPSGKSLLSRIGG